MFRFLITLVLAVALNASDFALLDSIRTALTTGGEMGLEIVITHRQYDVQYSDHGRLEIVGLNRYLLDLPDQQVKVLDETIMTWNKLTDQVVIDAIIPGDISIFDILSGDYSQIEVKNVKQDSSGYALDIDFTGNGIGGLIRIDKDFHPQTIEIEYSANDQLEIRIEKISILKEPVMFHRFSTDGKEVIDFRE